DAAGLLQERRFVAYAYHGGVDPAQHGVQAAQARELLFLELLLGDVERDRSHHRGLAVMARHREMMRKPPAHAVAIVLLSDENTAQRFVRSEHCVVMPAHALRVLAVPDLA